MGSLFDFVGIPLFHEALFHGFGAGRGADFELGCDWAVDGVDDDFGNGFNGLRVFGGLGEVAGGDLEGVEQEAGAARVDGVGGDAADDFADALEDGGAVLGDGELEGGFAVAAVL